jgi:hypothetical protein
MCRYLYGDYALNNIFEVRSLAGSVECVYQSSSCSASVGYGLSSTSGCSNTTGLADADACCTKCADTSCNVFYWDGATCFQCSAIPEMLEPASAAEVVGVWNGR